MTERTAITQVSQVGVESTPGQGVAANRRFQALSITPAIKASIQSFRPVGSKYAILAALGKEWVEAGISSEVACYNHLAYLFSGLLAYASPEQQGTSDAYLWTFTPQPATEDVIKTFSVEQGSPVRAGRFTYGLITELTIPFSRDKIEVSGRMIGQAYQDGITMTANPLPIAAQPILPTDLDIYLDSSSGTIGTTKLLRALSGEFGVSDRFGPVWTINSQVDGFVAHVEQLPKAQLKLLVEADSSGMGLLPPMRAGDRQYIRLKAVGPLIGATYRYKFQLDLCGVISDVGEFSDEDGVYAIEWTFDVAYDAGWGKAMEVQLVNTLSEL